MFYVIDLCPAKSICATLDILKIFSLQLGAQRIAICKMDYIRCYKILYWDNLGKWISIFFSRYKYLSTLATDTLGNKELKFLIDWRKWRKDKLKEEAELQYNLLLYNLKRWFSNVVLVLYNSTSFEDFDVFAVDDESAKCFMPIYQNSQRSCNRTTKIWTLK